MRTAALNLLLLMFTGLSSAGSCDDANTDIADFVLLFDTSPSMCPHIEAIASNFQALVLAISDLHVNAQFAIGNFGGPTRMRPFTTNATDAAETIIGLGCATDGQEASLEAIRRVLNNEFTYDSPLEYRTNASLNIFLITDEDSDLPISAEYQLPNQAEEAFVGLNLAEPGWTGYMTFVSVTQALSTSTRVHDPGYRFTYTPKNAKTAVTSTLTTSSTYTLPLRMPVRTAVGVPSLSPAFQKEVDITAELIAKKNAKVSIVMKRDHNVATSNILDSFSTGRRGSSYDILCDTDTSDLTDDEITVRNSITSFSCEGKDKLRTWTGALQFGNLFATSENDNFTDFDWETTLDSLTTYGLNNTLQAQVLKNGTGLVRLYNIDILAETTNSVLVTNMLAEVVKNYNYCQTSYLLVCTTTTVTTTETYFSTKVVSATATATLTQLKTYTTQAKATVTSIATAVVTEDELTTSEQISTVTTTNVDEVVATVTSFMTTIVTPTTTTASSSTAVPSSGSSKTPIYVGASIAGAAAAGAFFYFRSSGISDATAAGDALTSMNYNPLFAWQTQWNSPAWESTT